MGHLEETKTPAGLGYIGVLWVTFYGVFCVLTGFVRVRRLMLLRFPSTTRELSWRKTCHLLLG